MGWRDNEVGEAALVRCFRRASRWRAPPNWGMDDWREELRSIQRAAAFQAVRDFDTSRGIALDDFVYYRVMARSLTRYRQEWAYGLRCFSDARVLCHDSALDNSALNLLTLKDIESALAQLTESSRRLIIGLYWGKRTEIELARDLGVSQQAVNKRKQAALEALQVWFNGAV